MRIRGIVIGLLVMGCTFGCGSRSTPVALASPSPTPSVIAPAFPTPTVPALPTPSPQGHVAACRKAELEVQAGTRYPGDMQDIGVLIALKNVGKQACLLTGTPKAVLHGPGVPDLAPPDDPAPNTYPPPLRTPLEVGQTSAVRIRVPPDCTSHVKQTYDSATLTLPSGDEITIGGLHLMIGCGADISAFYSD